MSTDLYILIILIIFFVAIFLSIFISIHFEDVSIFLIFSLIPCIVASIAIIPVMVFDAFSHTPLTLTSASQISVQEINKISPNNNNDTLFNVTYTDTDENRKKVTVKEIAYDSDITYIEKTRKTYLFLYEDNYILHQQP